MKKKVMVLWMILGVVALTAIFCLSYGTVLFRNGNLGDIHPLNKAKEGQIKVACVGDSITYGASVKGWPENSYPSRLSKLLGNGYVVNNYGYSARTAMYDGDHPYVNEKLYQKSLDFQPDIVVIMLGTNDSKPYNWKGKDAYIADYSKLIDSYLLLDSHPDIYVVAPPPAFPLEGEVMFDISKELLAGDIRDASSEIAASKNLHFIDMCAAFSGRPELFIDGIHPNADGAAVFAQTVYSDILENNNIN